MLHKIYFSAKTFVVSVLGGWLIFCLPLTWLFGWSWTYIAWPVLCLIGAKSGADAEIEAREIESFRKAVERSNRY